MRLLISSLISEGLSVVAMVLGSCLSVPYGAGIASLYVVREW